jgi:ankyrin repeat protein
MLVDAGADVNRIESEGKNALIVAADARDDECVKFLLERGADIMTESPEYGIALEGQLAWKKTASVCACWARELWLS